MKVRIQRNGNNQFRIAHEHIMYGVVVSYEVISYHDTYAQAQEARAAYIAANDWQPVDEPDLDAQWADIKKHGKP